MKWVCTCASCGEEAIVAEKPQLCSFCGSKDIQKRIKLGEMSENAGLGLTRVADSARLFSRRKNRAMDAISQVDHVPVGERRKDAVS